MLVTWCKVIQNMHTIKSTYIVFKVLFLYIVRLKRVKTCHEVANNRGPALLCDVWFLKFGYITINFIARNASGVYEHLSGPKVVMQRY